MAQDGTTSLADSDASRIDRGGCDRYPNARRMSRLDLLAETREVLVLRLHGEPREAAGDRQRGVVCYVPASASASTVAGQLRVIADKLERRPGASHRLP